MRNAIPRPHEAAEGLEPPQAATDALSVRRARRSVPSIVYWAGGFALAAGAIWLIRAPLAEEIAELTLKMRGVPADLEIVRIDFAGVETGPIRLGGADAPTFTAENIAARFDWRTPWSVRLDDILVNAPAVTLGFAQSGIDWRALTPFATRDPDAAQPPLGDLRVENGRLTVLTDAGPIMGRFSASHDSNNDAWSVSATLDPAKLTQDDFTLELASGALEARLEAGAPSGRANLLIPKARLEGMSLTDGRIALILAGSPTHDGATLSGEATAQTAQWGAFSASNIRSDGQAVLAGATLETARDAPLNARLSIAAETAAIGAISAGVTKAAATLVRGGRQDTLDLSATLTEARLGPLSARAATASARFEGATGLLSSNPLKGAARGAITLQAGALDAPTRALLDQTLGGGAAPEPFGPLLSGLGGPITDALRAFEATAPLHAEIEGGKGAVRLAHAAVLRAANGVSATWTGRNGAPADLEATWSPFRLTGSGDLAFHRGRAPLATLEVDQLNAEAEKTQFNGRLTAQRWRAGGGDGVVTAPALELTLTPQGGLARFQISGVATGPMAGGIVSNARMALAGTADWSKAGFVLRTADRRCPRFDWDSLTIGEMRIGALSLPLCPAGGMLAQARSGRLSGAWSAPSVDLGYTVGTGRQQIIGRLKTNGARMTLGGQVERPKADIVVATPAIIATPPDSGTFTAKAPRAAMTLVLGGPGGWMLTGGLSDITARVDDFSIEAGEGALRFALRPDAKGVAGDITEISARTYDATRPVNVAPLLLSGAGRLRDNVLTADIVVASELGRPVGAAVVRQDVAAGRGGLAFTSQMLRFTPGGFEPKSLVPALQGVIADVSGAMGVSANVAWGGGPMTGDGQATFEGLNFSWAAGPAEGLRGAVRFDDIFKPSTPPGQTVTIAKLNPGVPLENAQVRFQLVDATSLYLESGAAPFALGALRLEPAVWRFDRSQQDIVVSVEDIDLGALIRTFKLDDMAGQGRLSGRLPLAIDGNQVRIVDGRIASSPEGGVFKYQGPLNRDLPDLPNPRDQLSKLATDPTWVTMKSLEDFRYDELSLTISGDLAGDIVAKGAFRGRNTKILQGATIRYGVNLEAPLGQLLSQIQPSTGTLGVTLPKGALEDALRLQSEDTKPVDGSAPPPK